MGLFKKKKKEGLTPEQIEELSTIPIEGGFSDFIDIGDDDGSGEFVLIENKSNRFLGYVSRVTKVILASLLIVLLTVSAYLLFSFKLVPAHVYGSTVEIGDYSVVSRYSEVNRDEIKNGNVILVKNDEYNDLFPFVMNFNIYTVTGRKGLFLYCETETGKVVTVETVDVLYIIKT